VARRLRSADQYTAAHIYINADLTPAEAKAAFKARKKRRDKKSQSSESSSLISLTVDEHAVLPLPTAALFVTNEGHAPVTTMDDLRHLTDQ